MPVLGTLFHQPEEPNGSMRQNCHNGRGIADRSECRLCEYRFVNSGTIRALIITDTMSWAPYYIHSIMGPKTLSLLLRPLHQLLPKAQPNIHSIPEAQAQTEMSPGGTPATSIRSVSW